MSSAGALAALRSAEADGGAALWATCRDPWVVRALLALHAATGAAAPVALLARAPEAHARFLLDALAEQLREPSTQATALASLPPLLYARPSWLHKLLPGPTPAHPLARELPRTAAKLNKPAPLLHAMLGLAALLAAAPSAAPQMLPDLVATLLRPASITVAPTTQQHLQQAQLALFHVLYATHPCSVLDALRNELAAASPQYRERLATSLAPLLASVRLHPALLTRRYEAERWARADVHDVLAEARRLSATSAPSGPPVLRTTSSPLPSAPSPPLEPPPGSAERAARDSLRGRTPLPDLIGVDSAPPTPLPPDDPPEAAVEATPENTPAGDARSTFRFPADSAAVRAIGRSTPSSPLRKEASPPADALSNRLARLAAERHAANSPVLFGGTAPSDVARPQPRHADEAEAWLAAPPPPPRPVRALVPPRPAVKQSPRYRSTSCPPRSHTSVSTQTDDTWPQPYEFMLEDFYRAMPSEPLQLRTEETVKPTEQLDEYLRALYTGKEPLPRDDGNGNDPLVRELSEQLALTHAALQYERWRRDAHAERNRRLLGSVRAAREADLAAAALQERLKHVAKERDALKQRRDVPTRPDYLAAERAARARAEAALKESEAARAHDLAELQKAKAEAAHAARHVDALARAAIAAERRADHIRSLRRQLLMLSEQNKPVAAAPPPPPYDRALRAQLQRVEAELDAVTAKADAATARAQALEAALQQRDDALADMRRSARAAADSAAERARAHEDKYKALRATVRAADSRRATNQPAPPPDDLPPLH